VIIGEYAAVQSVAVAARGIKGCFTRLIELRSSDEDRAANVAATASLLRGADESLVGGTSGCGRKHWTLTISILFFAFEGRARSGLPQ
jgi:hypothetical protein